MILEIFINICMSMVMFFRGNPSDEKVSRNIELLKRTDWFNPIYSMNKDLFTKDEHLRYIVGWAKVEKSLENEKKAQQLKEEIVEACKSAL
ncbi:hypothetical protein P6709_05610 [Jeotgalibacillus sp. ET6]|uniref:hypothetical protein n=1 Tax=Jeotgalibacillus sp. ET6 TaxID=3037260 RepID=UPI0024189256|nr:hypothetical protein [Jeotgalibacillus sp. ET6]MDG5471216.1 hypothetical protein [Jeotgalibacillus sp. ET6]